MAENQPCVMPNPTSCDLRLRRPRPSVQSLVVGFWLIVASGAVAACGMTATSPEASSEVSADPVAAQPEASEESATEHITPAATEQTTAPPTFFPLAKNNRQEGNTQSTQTNPQPAVVDAACQAPAFDSTDFYTSIDGDFDGDGLPDKLYLTRVGLSVEIVEDRFDLPPTELAVAFGDGGFTTGLLGVPGAGEAEDVRQVGGVPTVVRIAGLGHDAVIINEPGLSGAYASRHAIVHLDECAPEIIGWLSDGAGAANHLGWCTAPSATGEVIRSFQTRTNELQQFGAVEDRHLVWDGAELTELWPPVPATEPLCGSPLAPFIDSDSPETTPGPLSGDHGLSLQWVGWDLDLRGTVRFIGISDNHYQVVGRQSDDQGSWVQISGTIEHVSEVELRFDGIVESQVPYLNSGQPCIRSGSQTFLSTQGRQYWRLQDLLNCDGQSTDYVDIYF